MRQTLKKKLKSNRGASMILVLALFLICTMVSSIILAAASSGVSRNAQRVEQQNAYLAVSSAGDLIIEEVADLGVYAAKNITGRYGCQDCTIEGYIEYEGEIINGYRLDAEYTTNPADKDYVSNPLDDGHLLISKSHNPYVYAVTDEDLTTLDGVLGDLLKRACNQVFQTGAVYTETFTIGLGESDERLPDVTCLFQMDEAYDISFQLSTAEQDYSIVITAAATIKQGEITETTDVSDVHTIYYKKFIDTSDEVAGIESGSYLPMKEEWAIPIEVTTVVTEISWGMPSVEKGVLSQ